jgi:hypothetical protein
MRLEPFQAAHFDRMDLQPRQADVWSRHGSQEYLLLAQQHGGWSVFHGEQLLLCGGVIARIPAEPMLWSFISAQAGPCMLALTRVTRRFLQVCGHSFVYGTCEPDFRNGCRFLGLLGFERMRWEDGTPAVVPKYGLDGEDHALYEWVR